LNRQRPQRNPMGMEQLSDTVCAVRRERNIGSEQEFVAGQ
jgi:hypothetical protein